MSPESRIHQIGQSVLNGGPVPRAEAEWLCEIDNERLEELFDWSNRIRIHYRGDKVSFCSIVTGRVGACSEDCAFCSQSRHYNTHIQPGRTPQGKIAAAFNEAVNNGAVRMGIVNAGRCPTHTDLECIAPIAKQYAGKQIGLCASLGELNKDQINRLKDMGVTRVNHNLETSRRYFPAIVTTHKYDDRIETISRLVRAGVSVCSGGIFGLGESWSDRLDLAFTLRSLDVDVVPINFLHAIPGTPAYDRYQPLHPLEALRIIAIYRFILPAKAIKVAGGREKILGDLQSRIFHAGADSFLIGNYLTTIGRAPEDDLKMLSDLGLTHEKYNTPETSSPSALEPRCVPLTISSDT